MTDRAALARAFLAASPWADAVRAPLAGDASNRRYERLTDPQTARTAVFMDAPPAKGEDVRPFTRIARHLRGIGLSAPDVLAEDAENGFLILEDLGDDLFSRVVPARPELERELYETATDVLLALHAAPMIRLEAYDAAMMSELAGLALSKYARITDSEILARFRERFEDILIQTTSHGNPVLVQRDYHADNLLWLPGREGTARVGLLDFQDAMAGHPAYDLVSLLQDVRRDVPAAIEAAMIERYVGAANSDSHAFRTAYSVLGAQRSLRILGVFARLGSEYGRPHYVDMIPKVWEILRINLEHPALAPVAGMLFDLLPPPSEDHLAGLKR